MLLLLWSTKSDFRRDFRRNASHVLTITRCKNVHIIIIIIFGNFFDDRKSALDDIVILNNL